MTAMSETGAVDPWLADVVAAAAAVAADLPSSRPLMPGPPSQDARDIALPGMAVCARFTGAVHGAVAVVVGADLVTALQESPLGELDLTMAVRPALQSAAGTFGPAVLDTPRQLEPAAAITELAGMGDVIYVPLTDGDAIGAAVAVVVTNRPVAAQAVAGARRAAGFAAAGASAAAGVPAGPAGAPPVAPAGPAPVTMPAFPAGMTAGAAATSRSVGPGRRGLDLLHDVEMDVTAELGRTRMTVRDLLSLSPGAIVELDRAAGSPADLLVNGRLIACGEVVVVDENFGLRITEIVAPGAA